LYSEKTMATLICQNDGNASASVCVIDDDEETTKVKEMQWKEDTTSAYLREFMKFVAWMSGARPTMFLSILENKLNPATFKIECFYKYCNQKKMKKKGKGKGKGKGKNKGRGKGKKGKEDEVEEEEEEEEEVVEVVNYSYSAMNGMKSGILWGLGKQGIVLTQSEKLEMKGYFVGLRKRGQREKQSGERKMEEGKMPLPFEVYSALAKYFWQESMFFEAAYMILTWNLGCRTNNTEGIRMCHLHWLGDALRIEFAITKSNQKGERVEDRLLFANPLQPWICPVLALGAFLSTSSTEVEPSDRLFFGGDQGGRFLKSFKRAFTIPHMAEMILGYGLTVDDLGAHSLRKGAGTFMSTGSTASPSYASICIRMSWSLGNTQERYLHYNHAADGYCGRILSGLPQTSVNFAVLPPHPLHPLSCEVTKLVFPMSVKCVGVERVRQMCICSLVYHQKWLVSVLPSTSSLAYSFLFCNFSKIADCFTLMSGLTSPVMSPCGVPPHILTWVQNEETHSLLKSLPEKVLSGVSVVLKENGVGAGNVTREVLEELMRNMLETDRRQRGNEREVVDEVRGGVCYEAYLWADGMFHKLPEHFRFPTLTVYQCWQCWWAGNEEQKVPPFNSLTSHDISKVEKKRWSDITCIMKEVMRLLKEGHKIENDQLRKMKTEELGSWFQKAIEMMVRRNKKKEVRWNEWSLTTALRELRQARTEMEPSKKRKQRNPKKTLERNKNKRIKI
jgi:hypothetical protein